MAGNGQISTSSPLAKCNRGEVSGGGFAAVMLFLGDVAGRGF